MIPKIQRSILHTWKRIFCTVIQTVVQSRSLPTRGFKWLDPAEFSLDKYNYNSSRGCNLKVDLEYPKELHELHIDYPLAPDKLEIKREMLPDYL